MKKLTGGGIQGNKNVRVGPRWPTEHECRQPPGRLPTRFRHRRSDEQDGELYDGECGSSRASRNQAAGPAR